MPTMTRRKAILCSLGAIAATTGAGAVGLAGRRSRPLAADANTGPVTRTSWALGSNVSMTLVGLPPVAARRALDAAFAELELVEQVLSLYRPESQICRLNRAGVIDEPHPYLVEVLHLARNTAERTGGALDITVQPLWELYATAQKRGRLPGADEVAIARGKVNWRRVEISSRQIRLRGTGTAITLNGIAQGFAADRARAALASHGVEHALLNTGEVGILGTKQQGQPWTVGIQHPRAADAYVALAALDGRSLATSGDYETTFTADFRTNHIFDPRTGQSPQELASATIVAPTAVQADALSTAAMVLGRGATLELAARWPAVDALLVAKDGRTWRTAGFPEVEHEQGA
jgi:thiamine biosynthesis lipoprotein